MPSRPDNPNPNSDHWNDELDAYAQVLGKSPDLNLETNFGQGNYDKREFYQQIRNFQRAAKAMESFSRILLERAIYETKIKLAMDGISYESDDFQIEKDPVDPEPLHRRKKLLKAGEKRWEELNESDRALSTKQVVAITKKTGHDLDWQSFYAQTMTFFHEATRSINAELVRDFLTGIKELRGSADESTANALLGGKS